MGMHDGHRDRVKEDFLARPDGLRDHQLLELLLFYSNPRGDTNPTAHALMERFDSIAGVLDAPVEDLEKVPGVGRHTATLLKVAKAVSSRYLTSRTSVEEIVDSTRAAYELLRPYFFGARNERVYLLCMDGKGKSLGIRRISEGNANAAEVTTRGVTEAALLCNATRVILAHNHVSGLALPSAEDKSTTRYLYRVLGTVGVELVDHLVFVDDDMVSMRDSGFAFWE